LNENASKVDIEDLDEIGERPNELKTPNPKLLRSRIRRSVVVSASPPFPVPASSTQLPILGDGVFKYFFVVA
jgi:hypothetical protein